MNRNMVGIVSVVGAVALSAGAASAQWSDNFDSYSPGPLSGNGNWAPWCTGGADGAVSTQQARSAPHAFRASPGTDMVQQFTGANSGAWVFEAWVFVPTTATGVGNMVLLNTYCPAANQDWSIATNFNADTSTVTEWNGASVPLVKGQWAQYKLDIDFGSDTFSESYNGQVLVSGGSWSTNVLAGGQVQLVALDLFSESMDGIFYDDISLKEAGCYADCDGSGALNIFDYICFGNAYGAQQSYADCDGNGAFNIFDYICFGNAYGAGCP